MISVIWSYAGLSPTEMQGRITTVVERAMTTTVGSIEHLESTSVRGNSVIKLFFQPGADVNGAVAQVTAVCQTLLRPLPTCASIPVLAGTPLAGWTSNAPSSCVARAARPE